MKFKVVIQPPARQDIEAAFVYLDERAPAAARRWLDGIEAAIASLSRCLVDARLHRKARSSGKRFGTCFTGSGAGSIESYSW